VIYLMCIIHADIMCMYTRITCTHNGGYIMCISINNSCCCV